MSISITTDHPQMGVHFGKSGQHSFGLHQSSRRPVANEQQQQEWVDDVDGGWFVSFSHVVVLLDVWYLLSNDSTSKKKKKRNKIVQDFNPELWIVLRVSCPLPLPRHFFTFVLTYQWTLINSPWKKNA